jgi:NAD dependent epimerase/dehydratase family enzyme
VWLNHLSRCDGVVHLAGEPIAGKRWSAEYLTRVTASRVDSTKLIAETLARADRGCW